MKTQIKILGIIDISLGTYTLWILWDFMYESASDFIQRELTMTIFLVGLLTGGVGLLIKRKVGWIANQMTGIHIVLSAGLGIIFTNKAGVTSDNGTTTIILSIVILMIGARLFWTNKQQWLNEFKLSNKLRLATICIGTITSLVLLLKSKV